MGTDGERAAYVSVQLEAAAAALARGDIAMARVALRRLRSFDFSRRESAEAHLAVLRDTRSENDDVVTAIRKLVGMEWAA